MMHVNPDIISDKVRHLYYTEGNMDAPGLQHALNLISLNYSSVPFVYPADDTISVSVRTQIAAFQKVAGLEISGEADGETLVMLERLCRLSIHIRECIRMTEDKPKEKSYAGQELMRIFSSENSVDSVADFIPKRFFGHLSRQYPGKILERGDKGTDVSILQSCLRIISYEQKDFYFRNITGCYDEETEKAVKVLQKKYGLNEDGKTGFYIWNYVVNNY